MTKDNEKERLLKHALNQRLYFLEIEEKLVRVIYSLMADNVYTIDRAIPDLIEIINLLEFEHKAIMLEFNRILKLSD